MVGHVADLIFNDSSYNSNMIIAWIGIICYALQIYHDFSGYSDMAIGWVFFRADGLKNALIYIKNMFSFNFNNNSSILLIINNEFLFFIIIAIICSTPIIKNIRARMNEKFAKYLEYITLSCIFIISIFYMIGSTYNPFIYFRF